MSETILEGAIEIEVQGTNEEIQQVGGSLQALSDSLTADQLETIANFVENHPDGVAKIESWIKDPPFFLRPVLNHF